MSREEVEKLRASRTGQKSWITRSKKYTKLEEEIEIHPHSDPNDLDKDVDDIIKDFFDMAIQNKKEGDIMAAGTKKSEYQRTKYSTDDPNPDAHQDQEEDEIPRCYVCTKKHKPPYCVWYEACQRHHPRPYCRRKR